MFLSNEPKDEAVGAATSHSPKTVLVTAVKERVGGGG